VFYSYIPVDEVLPVGKSITAFYQIPIDALQNLLSIYEIIRKNHSEYITQFYRAVLLIINEQYRESKDMPEDDGELPF
jgi:hypothetical protein